MFECPNCEKVVEGNPPHKICPDIHILTTRYSIMKAFYQFLVALSVVTMVGCTVGGSEVINKNEVKVCTDSRDGETFSFNTNSVTNVRRGIGAPTTFNVIDSEGNKRSLSTSMEVYLKCK